MTVFATEPVTVGVMTGMRERRWFKSLGPVPDWRSLPRDEGFRVFAERFAASAYRMVVVVPDFANFSAEYNQSFVYLPVTEFDGGRASAEREFLSRCIDRIRPQHAEAGESAEVLQLDGRFVAEAKNGPDIVWTAPLDVVARSGKVVSKRTSLAAILPALRRGIGPDEGGVYTPYGGDGIFHLLSV